MKTMARAKKETTYMTVKVTRSYYDQNLTKQTAESEIEFTPFTDPNEALSKLPTDPQSQLRFFNAGFRELARENAENALAIPADAVSEEAYDAVAKTLVDTYRASGLELKAAREKAAARIASSESLKAAVRSMDAELKSNQNGQ